MRGEGFEPSQAHRPTAPQTVASAISPSSQNISCPPLDEVCNWLYTEETEKLNRELLIT